MPESLSAQYAHLVFSTKHRAPLLAGAAWREAMHGYLAGTSAGLGCPALAVGGVADHVHLLARQARTIAPADWVKELKRASSSWANTQPAAPAGFAWQAGYGLFSVSASQLEKVRHYVLAQAEHHRQATFQDEYRRLLQAHALAWDEAYVWD